MGFFSSSSRKQATAGCADTADHGSTPALTLPLPRMDDFAGLPYQQASLAVSMPALASTDHSMASPPSHDPFAPPYPPPPNIVVNQHYYIAAAPLQNIPEAVTNKAPAAATAPTGISRFHLGSVVNLATDMLPMSVPHLFEDRPAAWHVQAPGTTLLNQGAALYDQLSSRFDRVMTAIDRDRYEGSEGELFSYGPTPQPAGPHTPGGKPDYHKGQTTGVVSSLISGSYFAKVDFYANSKLPLNLPPMKLYIASYRLLSLAAQYSDRAYLQPQGAERFAHIEADWRTGTKAMVIKCVPMDDASTIVFAIRGTANFMDWAVNLNMAPASPAGFLDDRGNLCHAGFLSVARKMVRPVAARLRQLIEEDPSRAAHSLLITGHSAGGAVASLLYAHMMAASADAASELNLLTGCFRRVHCITFGTPPVSLLPLQRPEGKAFAKSMFYSFVNEGDPVARADRAYVKSLLDLFASSVPRAAAPKGSGKDTSTPASVQLPHKEASQASLQSTKTAKSSRSHHGRSSKMKHNHGRGHGQGQEDQRSHSGHSSRGGSQKKPVWVVPPSTLSNAGRIIVLRSGNPRSGTTGKKTVDERLSEGVVAQFSSDAELRGVIWGDPVCHVMKLYAGRIEALAIAAVTGGP
ncbi:hypothetical protein SCUCBS95973_007182 [Sporothrix curviconia]|uniref:Fungal lipase-type domain-containing protein n=1 Tax=Sporothrix curviconia TaxID=1260050 RepID=A0ABP0CBB5_9PEZI